MEECPNCHELVEPEDIVICKRCGRKYCENCVDVYTAPGNPLIGEVICTCDD